MSDQREDETPISARRIKLLEAMDSKKIKCILQDAQDAAAFNLLKNPASPSEVASFLHLHANVLDREELGKYLVGHGNAEVMLAYLSQFSLAGLEPDVALYRVLHNFVLPGEASLIDRLLEKLSHVYCEQNPTFPRATTYDGCDAVYTLFFSILMLSTDAKSPHVKVKMTADQFLRSNRGVNNGKDFPDEFLLSLAQRIIDAEQTVHLNGSNRELAFTKSLKDHLPKWTCVSLDRFEVDSEKENLALQQCNKSGELQIAEILINIFLFIPANDSDEEERAARSSVRPLRHTSGFVTSTILNLGLVCKQWRFYQQYIPQWPLPGSLAADGKLYYRLASQAEADGTTSAEENNKTDNPRNSVVNIFHLKSVGEHREAFVRYAELKKNNFEEKKKRNASSTCCIQ